MYPDEQPRPTPTAELVALMKLFQDLLSTMNLQLQSELRYINELSQAASKLYEGASALSRVAKALADKMEAEE